MQGEDIFLGQKDLGKIFILLNCLEKSGFREKRKKNSLRRYPLRRYRVYTGRKKRICFAWANLL